MSLSGCPQTFIKRRERTIVPRSRRTMIRSHGRSKRGLGISTCLIMCINPMSKRCKDGGLYERDKERRIH